MITQGIMEMNAFAGTGKTNPNKPNSKPKQSQSKPIKANFKPNQSQFQTQTNPIPNPNKPNFKPNQTQNTPGIENRHLQG